MSVSGKTGLMIILAAGALGFIIALAGSPGIRSPGGEVIYVSVFVTNERAEGPE